MYTLDFVFQNRGIKYELTNDWSFLQKSSDFKFVYSERFEEEILKIEPSPVLFDEVIFDYSLGKEIFFQQDCLTFDRILDPFASIFFILSRMEEYTVKQRDIHDRFQAQNSVLKRFNWIEQCICDRWAEDIITFLEEKLDTTFKKEKQIVNFIPSFDIDNTFAFKWKEGSRRLLSIGKDILKNDKIRLKLRKEVESGKVKDPYDTYDYIKSLKEKGFDVLIFWLLGDLSKYDRNISALDLRHQELIKEIGELYQLGLHPSYASNSSNYNLSNEKETLEQLLSEKVTISRQHFLKINLPFTYLNLQKLGFTDDYSMGFADAVGFRSGTAKAHFFYDLNKNTCTDFVLHPFAYMDGSLNQYMKLSPEEAKEKIRNLFLEVKKYGGDFIFLWHNETISEAGIWQGWKDVFEYTLALKNEL
jgi:hypothetical protein